MPGSQNTYEDSQWDIMDTQRGIRKKEILGPLRSTRSSRPIVLGTSFATPDCNGARFISILHSLVIPARAPHNATRCYIEILGVNIFPGERSRTFFLVLGTAFLVIILCNRFCWDSETDLLRVWRRPTFSLFRAVFGWLGVAPASSTFCTQILGKIWNAESLLKNKSKKVEEETLVCCDWFGRQILEVLY